LPVENATGNCSLGVGLHLCNNNCGRRVVEHDTKCQICATQPGNSGLPNIHLVVVGNCSDSLLNESLGYA